MNNVYRMFLVALLGLLIAACRSSSPVIEPDGAPREGDLSPGETAAYQIALEQDDYVDLVVEQRGIDVAVALVSPGRETLVEVDGLLGASGPERIVWIASEPGSYLLEIRAPAGDALPGAYAVSLEERRPASKADRQKAEAVRLFWEAERLEIAGELEEAVGEYEDALERFSSLGDDYWTAIVHYSLAFVHRHISLEDERAAPNVVVRIHQPRKSLHFYDTKKALHHYERSLILGEQIDRLRAGALYSVANIYNDLYDLEAARRNFQQSLSIWRSLNDRPQEAGTLNNLGLMHRFLGELREALVFYDQAIAIWRELGELAEEANSLHNRAWCFMALGRLEQALADFNSALEIWGGLPETDRMTASTLTGLGGLLLRMDRLDEAQDRLERALELWGDDRLDKTITRVQIASLHLRKGDPEKAGAIFEECLKIFRDIGYQRGEATALLGLGQVREDGSSPQALRFYDAAREVAAKVGDRDIEANAYLALARSHRRQGRLVPAREHIETALDIVDELRRTPHGLELSSIFFASKQKYYDFYIDLLMEMARRYQDGSYEALALAANERSRARALLDMLIDSGIDLRRGGATSWLERERELERRLTSKYFQRESLLAQNSDLELIDSVQKELEDLVLELEVVRGEIRRGHPVYSSLTQPRPLDAERIQEDVLDEQTLLLEFQLGSPRSYLWAVTREAINTVELPDREVIESQATWAFRVLTDSPGRTTLNRGRLRKVLAELSETLIRPVAEELDKARILVVAEGALQYVPFGALPSPRSAAGDENQEPLIARHEIVHLPSASALGILRGKARSRQPPARGLAAFADPVLPGHPADGASSESRVSRSRGGMAPRLARLYFSRQEAQYIFEQAPGDANLLALGDEATKARALSDDIAQYRFLHFATHSIIDTELPELSSLVFSDSRSGDRDDRLFTHEIYKLRLQADLVVLSACRTADGKDIRGEGLVGWTHGFMYSGARRVLVSLWDVDDEATAHLMKYFYACIFKEGLSPAAALRKAQDSIRRHPRWSAPYYWAGFVIQGEFL